MLDMYLKLRLIDDPTNPHSNNCTDNGAACNHSCFGLFIRTVKVSHKTEARVSPIKKRITITGDILGDNFTLETFKDGVLVSDAFDPCSSVSIGFGRKSVSTVAHLKQFMIEKNNDQLSYNVEIQEIY